MLPSSAGKPSQRKRFGAASRVVLVAAPPALLQRMSAIVAAIEGVTLAGAFDTPEQAIDWIQWKRPHWQLAYVDMTMPGAGDVVQELRRAGHAGTLVGLCAHLWREERERCEALGVARIVEKGDLIAFQDDVEVRGR